MWMDTSAVAIEPEAAATLGALRTELTRLGCGFRNCGVHGLIFSPRNTGGFNIEHGLLHYWDLGINIYLDKVRALEALAALPNNIGQEKVCGSLLEIVTE
jgi:hypothetical protein